MQPGSCPRGGTLGRWGAQVVKKVFFKRGHVAYQIDKDDEQNRMQVKFSSQGQTGDLGVSEVRGQISLNSGYHVNFEDFYTKLCVCLTNERFKKNTKHTRRDFYSVALVMPQGWDFGALGMSRGILFSNMVMWHIKSTGMTSRTERK